MNVQILIFLAGVLTYFSIARITDPNENTTLKESTRI